MKHLTECPACGGKLEHVRDRQEIRIGERSALVNVERSRCVDCGEIYYSPEQMDQAQRAASDEVRRRENLLSSDQIRSIRTVLGLSQAQFEHLLGVGEKTVVRWERGTVFQNKATDVLIRLLRDVPGVFEYLKEQRGMGERVELPAKWPTGHGLIVTLAKRLGDKNALRKERSVSASDFKRSTIRVRVQETEPFPIIPEEALR